MQFKIFVFTVALMFSNSLLAEETVWELGGGIGGLGFRLYPGSSQSNSYVLPLPYFTLRSKYFEIDRGIRGLVPSNSDWRIDISADFGLPVNSADSFVREGMPDLDPIIQIGPSLEYSFTGRPTSSPELRFEMPLRSAIAINSNGIDTVGWLTEPRLVYEQRRAGRSGIFYKVRAGLKYASTQQNAYYYAVSSDFVTAERALFEASNGYSGFVLDVRTAWREKDVIFWWLARYQNLTGAVFEDSPLVEDKNYFLMGVGITWLLMGSKY